MMKLNLEDVRKIAGKYGLTPCRVRGTNHVQIRKRKSENLEDVSWEEFSEALTKRRLAVYKSEDSDFIKIMKDK